MKPITIEWQRHPKDRRPAHEAQWMSYIDGQIVSVEGRPTEGQYIPGSGMVYAFRDMPIRYAHHKPRPFCAMRYYIA